MSDEPKDLEPVRSPPLETPCDVTKRLDGIREPKNVPETIPIQEDSDDERDDLPLSTRPFKETRSTGGAVVAGLPDGRLTPAVSLKTLVESGHIKAGPEALWISYVNNTWSASLGADGVIKFEGKDFHSPSAWAVFCKRIAKPGKKTDDGWKSVRCEYPDGPSLEDIRRAYTESAAVSYRSERERSVARATQKAETREEFSRAGPGREDQEAEEGIRPGCSGCPGCPRHPRHPRHPRTTPRSSTGWRF